MSSPVSLVLEEIVHSLSLLLLFLSLTNIYIGWSAAGTLDIKNQLHLRKLSQQLESSREQI